MNTTYKSKVMLYTMTVYGLVIIVLTVYIFEPSHRYKHLPENSITSSLAIPNQYPAGISASTTTI